MRQDQRRAQQSDVEFKYGLCDCFTIPVVVFIFGVA